MQIDYALILSAGFGTRMGEIGKSLPKVMWPILNCKLIDLQISYCKNLNIKKIYINTHYLAEVIEEHIKKNYGNEIIILRENPIQDSGGAIHNLAMRSEVGYQGNLLMLNGDQFFLFDKRNLEEGLENLKTCRATLFGIEVLKNEKYNETIIKNNLLAEIVKPSNEKNFITYSGVGILKLDQLNKVDGPSKFFQTVADYKNENVSMIVPDHSEYWDFGTAEIYFNNMFKVFDNRSEKNLINNFLKNSGVDFSLFEKYISGELKSIKLKSGSRFSAGALVMDEIVQKI